MTALFKDFNIPKPTSKVALPLYAGEVRFLRLETFCINGHKHIKAGYTMTQPSLPWLFDKGSSMMYRLVNWALRQSKPRRRAIQLFFDVVLILSCFALAMALRLDRWSFLQQLSIWYVLVPVLPISIFGFVKVGLYRAVIRFISSRIIKGIILVSLVSGAVMFVANLVYGHLIPRSVPIIYSVLLFCALAGLRFGLRAIANVMTATPAENVVIYGAGDAGRQLLNALNLEGTYRVVAYVDDDEAMQGREMDTISIFSPSALGDLKQAHDVNLVLLAAPSARISQRRRIISLVEQHALQLRSIPSVIDIVSGKARVNDFEDIDVQDLLAREIVPPIPGLIAMKVKNKSVVVTGAGGSIGSELCRQIILLEPKSLLLYEMSEHALYKIHSELMETVQNENLNIEILPFMGSVQNKRRLEHLFSECDVATVFHAAAYKHVPLVEQNVIDGIVNNVFGTRTVVEAAIEAGVETFTLISTDKAVRPTNFMGASKRLAELVCQSCATTAKDTKISIVRFGNVMWSSGSVMPRFKEQIMSGGPVTVTHPEITRYFMTIPEAAQLVLQASAMSEGGEVFVLDMGEPVKILELAKSMVRLQGMLPQLDQTKALARGEIAIHFSGIRPGEKLHEELVVGDKTNPTRHPKITSAEERMLVPADLETLLAELQRACDSMDVAAVNRVILNAPIGFSPQQGISDLLTKTDGAADETPVGRTA